MNDTFDVTVVGAGPGGYVAAIRAAQLGLKTAIVEKKYWGGVCLNVGCIPSKALLRNAELAHLLQHRAKEFGLRFDNLTLDFGAAFKRSRQVSNRLVKGVRFLMRKNGITVYEGTANLLGPDRLQVALNDGGEAALRTRNLIIATGARPRTIPGVEIGGPVLDYEHAILSKTLPASAIIIGAGAIGVEFSYIWRSYGVQVTLVEMLDQILPLEDPEISAELAQAYKKLKINLLTSTRVAKIETGDDGVRVTVSTNGETQTLQAEVALMAIGFRPNVEGFGLENLGVAQSERGGFIEIDAQMRTNVPGVYAIGDVTGKLMLAHVASAQGITAAEAIAGRDTPALNYEMMPRATYCHPQVASFGLTEHQARERGYQVNVGRFPFQANGKALGLGERTGLVKIIADARYGEILGAHMIGPEVTELLPELVLAHNAELTAAEIARSVHAHPTLSEVLMEAAHDVEGQPIHT